MYQEPPAGAPRGRVGRIAAPGTSDSDLDPTLHPQRPQYRLEREHGPLYGLDRQCNPSRRHWISQHPPDHISSRPRRHAHTDVDFSGLTVWVTILTSQKQRFDRPFLVVRPQREGPRHECTGPGEGAAAGAGIGQHWSKVDAESCFFRPCILRVSRVYLAT